MTDTIEQLHRLWEDAAMTALENSRRASGTAQQKNTAEKGGEVVRLSQRDNSDNSIKDQLKANLNILNSMETVASIQEFKTFEYKQQTLDWVLKRLENTGYKVNRKGFGEIIIDKKRLKSGLSYSKTNEEKLGFAVLPQVLAKGVEIDTHIKHKNRAYDTVTFAAPVVINGQRGNMAVVVRQEGKNYYKVHRLVMPDGSQFILNKKRDIAETAGGVDNNSGLSPADNVSKNSIRNPEKKVKDNVKKSERDVKYGDSNNKITANMTDSQRAKILKNKSISNVAIVKDISADILEKTTDISSWEDINNLFGSKKSTLIQKLASEFGAFKGYLNADINISFEFSKNNFRESYHKQKVNYEQFAKMFSVFDSVVENAIGIEVHNRNTEGYKTDITLNNVYVLMSAFEDGDYIIPVKLEIKEFKDKQNTLYVAISLQGIKKAEVSKQGNTENGVTQNSRSAIISIADLFTKINPKDVDFLKYIPNELLTDNQIAAKNKVINTVKLSERDPEAVKQYEQINRQLEKENQKLREDVSELKELVRLQRTLTHGKMFTKSSLDIVAKRIMNYAGAKGNTAELADGIKV